MQKKYCPSVYKIIKGHMVQTLQNVRSAKPKKKEIEADRIETIHRIELRHK